MEFLIADSFTSSLARLTGDEQKAAKTTAFDLQMNLQGTSLRFHKLERAKDKNFCSVRAGRDIRIILHRSRASLLLCYVAHHDAAYHWAERRKLETHPRTGAAQLVEIRERVEEVLVPASKPLLFASLTEDELLSYGVPPEWLADVQRADEDSILELATHLPEEAAEALLQLATGGRVGYDPSQGLQLSQGSQPSQGSQGLQPSQPLQGFAHPDARRRFRVVHSTEELERALDAPWEKWAVFLHPAQHNLVERDFRGPARVLGSAGTGKTVVALHRAVFLAQQNRVWLTTFSGFLAAALQQKARHLLGSATEVAERLEIASLDSFALRLYQNCAEPKTRLNQEQLAAEMAAVCENVPDLPKWASVSFVFQEWLQVVDAWQLNTWEEYRDVRRLGRKKRLPEVQRKVLWGLFVQMAQKLREQNAVSMAGVYGALTNALANGLWENQPENRPFVVVDEAQDIGVPQLRFLAALSENRPNSLFFCGDLGQRIFQQAFSWKALGVDIRGRSATLRLNYRTSHQIRLQADQLLDPTVSDVDGNSDERSGTISLFNGPAPQLCSFDSIEEEIAGVAQFLERLCTEEGVTPEEMGLIVRSERELSRAEAALNRAQIAYARPGNSPGGGKSCASLCTMHLAKGLEFKAVVVMACDDVVVPLQERLEGASEDADLKEVYETERHLLYVAATRAREWLMISSGAIPSEFLEDLGF